jgi:hypothetical protein
MYRLSNDTYFRFSNSLVLFHTLSYSFTLSPTLSLSLSLELSWCIYSLFSLSLDLSPFELFSPSPMLLPLSNTRNLSLANSLS